MRSPTSYFDLRVQLSQWRSWWIAECAVHRGVSLEDFLEWRLRIYQALYRLSHYPLPFDVAIEHGKPIKVPNPNAKKVWEQLRDDDPTGEDAAEHFRIQSERQQIARELEELEDEAARLNHIGHEVRHQLEAVESEQVERIGRGEMEGPRTKGRRDRARRRPRLSIPWGLVAGCLALVLLILCEAYQFAQPLLDSIGVDTSNLPREWKRNPLGVLNGALFAIAASAGLFYLWHKLTCAGLTLSRSWEASPFVLARRVAGIVLLSGGLLVGTILMANMRHGATENYKDFQEVQHDQSTGTAMGIGVFVFLTMIVPCTAAALHAAIGQSPYWQARRDIAAHQARFDQQEDARLVPAETVADCLALLAHQRDQIEQERTRLQTERRALAEQAQAAEQARREKLQHARWCTLVYAQSLLAAIQQDRYFFIRSANRSKADAPRVHEHEPTPPPRQFVHPLLTAARNGHRV